LLKSAQEYSLESSHANITRFIVSLRPIAGRSPAACA